LENSFDYLYFGENNPLLLPQDGIFGLLISVRSFDSTNNLYDIYYGVFSKGVFKGLSSQMRNEIVNGAIKSREYK
jgi:hypothetical protein